MCSLTNVLKGFIETVFSELPMTLTNGIRNGNAVDYKIYGQSIQNGIPSPKSPVDVESVGELVTDETEINYGKYKIQIKATNGIEEKTIDIFLDEPLRKAGDYADYIDYENQVVVRNVKKFELKTTDNFMHYTWLQKRGLYVSDKLDDSYNRNANALSNRNYNSWNDAQNATNPSGMWVGAGSPFFYWNGILDVLGLTTIGEFKTWLADNPTYVLYGSKKPITTPIIIPNLPVFKGTTVYFVDTTPQPSRMETTYYATETISE